MKIKEILYETPEMSEEKLLEIINNYCKFINKSSSNRLKELYNKRNNTYSDNLPKIILEEYDLIQEKKSYLTKSQRDQICGLVGMCLIQMTKGNEG